MQALLSRLEPKGLSALGSGTSIPGSPLPPLAIAPHCLRRLPELPRPASRLSPGHPEASHRVASTPLDVLSSHTSSCLGSVIPSAWNVLVICLPGEVAFIFQNPTPADRLTLSPVLPWHSFKRYVAWAMGTVLLLWKQLGEERGGARCVRLFQGWPSGKVALSSVAVVREQACGALGKEWFWQRELQRQSPWGGSKSGGRESKCGWSGVNEREQWLKDGQR